MIDTSLRIPPVLFDRAEAGDDGGLRDELAAADLDAEVVDAIVGAVTTPEVRFTVVSADERGATVRRAHLSPVVSLLHADGDDRDEVGAVLVTRSAAELLHVVLGGLAFGPRPPHPQAETITLDDPQDALLMALAQRELPAEIAPPSERPIRWWSFGFEGGDLDGHPAITVLDAEALWRQSSAVLTPTDALHLWCDLAEVLRVLSVFERPAEPDDDPDTEPDGTGGPQDGGP